MSKFKFVSIILVFCALLPWGARAQETPFFTNKQHQYAYFNPAYIPELQYATIGLGGRFQWGGLEGSPINGFFSGKYFFVGAHSQVGLNILYDKIGYQQIVNPKVTYAFCVPIGDDSYLNLGVSAGLMNKSYDVSEIILDKKGAQHENDILLSLEKGTAPDIDVGFEFLIQNFEFGGSATHLLSKTDFVSMNRTYFAFANCNFQSTEWWRLSPHYSFYYFDGDDRSEDIMKHQVGLYFYYITDYDNVPTDLFYVAAAYRIPYEASFMAGFSWGVFSIFYSYDYFFGDLRHDSFGSHEIGIEFKIKQNDRGCYANYGRAKKKYTRYYRMR